MRPSGEKRLNKQWAEEERRAEEPPVSIAQAFLDAGLPSDLMKKGT